MSEHYIVTVDRGCLRIYAETPGPDPSVPRIQMVEAIDFPIPTGSSHDDEVSAASANADADLGRGRQRAAEERLTRTGEADVRNQEMIAIELDTFLQNRPEASWDFAAAPSLYQSLIERLSPGTRRRMKRSLSRTMINQRADEVRAVFATAGSFA